ncbi:hypothetical protein DM05_4957 [Pseudomonas poae]|uniref:Uncharacterized protein n=1 Tax=Pseudomonas poae TaxID=200451 RepID=A0A7Z1K0F4_9PSED|nr:hypothetical protein [Pseudomonas poae]PFG60251.1 hypothetical protein DM05_4957 [Pseudomonas poae]
MLYDAEMVTQNQFFNPTCIAGTDRRFSSSASSMKIRMSEQNAFEQLHHNYASVQSLIGALVDRSIPTGLTGFVKEQPRLVLTIDKNESISLDSNTITLFKNVPIEKEIIADITFKSQLENIQSNLGLSITQLSQFFGVTRKSVYDWLDGTAPRSSNSKRLDVIAAVIAASSDKSSLSRLKGVWLTSVNGKSFMDVISDETLSDSEKVSAALLKLEELSPRLGTQEKSKNKTYLGEAHTTDFDRVADLG